MRQQFLLIGAVLMLHRFSKKKLEFSGKLQTWGVFKTSSKWSSPWMFHIL